MPRKTPILLRRGPISGNIHALLRYKLTADVLVAYEKQDVSFDFYHLALEEMFGADDECPDIIGILDGVADGEVLNDREKAQVRRFHDHFRAMVVKHNERLENRSVG